MEFHIWYQKNPPPSPQVFVVRVAELVVQAGPMDSDRLDCFSDSLILRISSFGVFSYLEVLDLFFEETIIWRLFSRKPMEESLNGKYTNTHVMSAWDGKERHCMDVTVWKKFRNLSFPGNTISPDVTSKKVAELNSVLFADFHRILKKYQAVRKIVRSLAVCHIRFDTSSNITNSSLSYVWFILPLVMLTLIPSQTSLNFHYCTLWKKILSVVLLLAILIFISS